jgi:hypothetical protein
MVEAVVTSEGKNTRAPYIQNVCFRRGVYIEARHVEERNSDKERSTPDILNKFFTFIMLSSWPDEARAK